MGNVCCDNGVSGDYATPIDKYDLLYTEPQKTPRELLEETNKKKAFSQVWESGHNLTERHFITPIKNKTNFKQSNSATNSKTTQSTRVTHFGKEEILSPSP